MPLSDEDDDDGDDDVFGVISVVNISTDNKHVRKPAREFYIINKFTGFVEATIHDIILTLIHSYSAA